MSGGGLILKCHRSETKHEGGEKSAPKNRTLDLKTKKPIRRENPSEQLDDLMMSSITPYQRNE